MVPNVYKQRSYNLKLFSDGADTTVVYKPSHFTVDTSRAGPGDLSVTCRGPQGNYPVEVRPLGNGLFSATFTAKTSGEYLTRFTFNEKEIPRSPYKTSVSDSGKCVLIPEGKKQETYDQRVGLVSLGVIG